MSASSNLTDNTFCRICLDLGPAIVNKSKQCHGNLVHYMQLTYFAGKVCHKIDKNELCIIMCSNASDLSNVINYAPYKIFHLLVNDEHFADLRRTLDGALHLFIRQWHYFKKKNSSNTKIRWNL